MTFSSQCFFIKSIILCSMLIGCAAQERQYPFIRTPENCEVVIDSSTEISSDSTYGFEIENAVRVGKGPENEYLYLSKLLGPNGKNINRVSRLGSTFTTYKDGKDLIVDIFVLYIEDKAYEKVVYVDMYNCEKQKILNGFSKK